MASRPRELQMGGWRASYQGFASGGPRETLGARTRSAAVPLYWKWRSKEMDETITFIVDPLPNAFGNRKFCVHHCQCNKESLTLPVTPTPTPKPTEKGKGHTKKG